MKTHDLFPLEMSQPLGNLINTVFESHSLVLSTNTVCLCKLSVTALANFNNWGLNKAKGWYEAGAL